jgi:hypothetical protein
MGLPAHPEKGLLGIQPSALSSMIYSFMVFADG